MPTLWITLARRVRRVLTRCPALTMALTPALVRAGSASAEGSAGGLAAGLAGVGSAGGASVDWPDPAAVAVASVASREALRS